MLAGRSRSFITVIDAAEKAGEFGAVIVSLTESEQLRLTEKVFFRARLFAFRPAEVPVSAAPCPALP